LPTSKKTRREHEVRPERNPNRRSLTHVGGRVRFWGDEALQSSLAAALDVEPDEDSTRRHVHGFHSYPARLHPDTARALIEAYSASGDTVLDPFCGSGTVLVEARLLGRAAVGRDLNPLAVALAKLKSGGSSEGERDGWLAAAEQVVLKAEERRETKEPPTKLYGAEDLELFEIHVLLELDGLKKAILDLPTAAARRVLLLALSSLITKVSRRHGDSSRKRSERRLPSGYTIDLFGRRVDELVQQMAAFAKALPKGSPMPQLKRDDARSLASVADRSVDLVVASPPYPGVYDYLDHHATRLRWLGMDARGLSEQEMGSRRQLNKLSAEEARERWQKDFDRNLGAIARVLRPGNLACFVIGDTAVAGAVLRADEVARRGALSAGLSCRAIASQKRPQFHAQSSRTFGGAPRLEHVIVFERTAPAPREKGALGVRKKSSRPTRR
jgi:DNA modification methylase